MNGCEEVIERTRVPLIYLNPDILDERKLRSVLMRIHAASRPIL
jgi:hypothetical protein